MEPPNKTNYGRRLNHYHCGAPAADLFMVKLLLSSNLSTLKANFITIIKMSQNAVKRYTYLQLNIEQLPKDIKKQHNLKEKATTDGYAYVGRLERHLQLTASRVVSIRTP